MGLPAVRASSAASDRWSASVSSFHTIDTIGLTMCADFPVSLFPIDSVPSFHCFCLFFLLSSSCLILFLSPGPCLGFAPSFYLCLPQTHLSPSRSLAVFSVYFSASVSVSVAYFVLVYVTVSVSDSASLSISPPPSPSLHPSP